jgi:hypothetical protein
VSSSRRPSKRPTARREAAKETKAKRPVPSRASTPALSSRPAIRLSGSSASSRLTIKPGGPTITRPTLELSTKPRPGGLRPLSQVELDEDEVLVDAFDATLDGLKVRITAVLERTCVYLSRDGDRKLARKDDLWVEANKLPIRRRALT